MADVQENDDQVASKGRRNVQRGRTSPSHSLEDAISGIEQVHTALGTTRHQRDDAAQAMGYKPGSGAANSRVGSLTHFGLLERHGAEYEVSALALRILTPTDDQERIAAIAEAAVAPSLYSELVQQLDGQPLPPMLSNILQRNYGVVPKSASDVANRFEESLRYARLLVDGKVYATLQRAGASPTALQADQEVKTNNDDLNGESKRDKTDAGHKLDSNNADYRIPLRAKRSAFLVLPKTIDSTDIERIKSWLDLMADVLTESDEEEDKINSEATE